MSAPAPKIKGLAHMGLNVSDKEAYGNVHET